MCNTNDNGDAEQTRPRAATRASSIEACEQPAAARSRSGPRPRPSERPRFWPRAPPLAEGPAHHGDIPKRRRMPDAHMRLCNETQARWHLSRFLRSPISYHQATGYTRLRTAAGHDSCPVCAGRAVAVGQPMACVATRCASLAPASSSPPPQPAPAFKRSHQAHRACQSQVVLTHTPRAAPGCAAGRARPPHISLKGPSQAHPPLLCCRCPTRIHFRRPPPRACDRSQRPPHPP